jgi:hypothetical protein
VRDIKLVMNGEEDIIIIPTINVVEGKAIRLLKVVVLMWKVVTK